MEIFTLTKSDWAKLSENAHLLAFSKTKPSDWDRIDYAILAVHDEKPVGYVTVRETDHETVYWQFGGAMPWVRKSLLAGRAYDAILATQGKRAKRITTKIENTNYPMLRLAMSRGFVIVGCGHYNGTTLVDLVKEYGNG